MSFGSRPWSKSWGRSRHIPSSYSMFSDTSTHGGRVERPRILPVSNRRDSSPSIRCRIATTAIVCPVL